MTGLGTIFVGGVGPIYGLYTSLTHGVVCVLEYITGGRGDVVDFRVRSTTGLFLLFLERRFVGKTFVETIFGRFGVTRTLRSSFGNGFGRFFGPTLELLYATQGVCTSCEPTLGYLGFGVNGRVNWVGCFGQVTGVKLVHTMFCRYLFVESSCREDKEGLFTTTRFYRYIVGRVLDGHGGVLLDNGDRFGVGLMGFTQ